MLMEKEEGYRQVNYMLETIMCGRKKDAFFLSKYIYIPSPGQPSDEIQNKFTWILESILAAKRLNNFDIAWLPFNISGYEGKKTHKGCSIPEADRHVPGPRTNRYATQGHRVQVRRPGSLHGDPRLFAGGRPLQGRSHVQAAY